MAYLYPLRGQSCSTKTVSKQETGNHNNYMMSCLHGLGNIILPKYWIQLVFLFMSMTWTGNKTSFNWTTGLHSGQTVMTWKLTGTATLICDKLHMKEISFQYELPTCRALQTIFNTTKTY